MTIGDRIYQALQDAANAHHKAEMNRIQLSSIRPSDGLKAADDIVMKQPPELSPEPCVLVIGFEAFRDLRETEKPDFQGGRLGFCVRSNSATFVGLPIRQDREMALDAFEWKAA